MLRTTFQAPVLHNKFQAPKPECSGDEEIKNISVLKPDSLLYGNFGFKGLHLKKVGKGLLGNAIYQILRHLLSEGEDF